jgi:hypothetical protein
MKFKSLLFSVNDKTFYRSSGPHRIANHIRQQGWDCEVIDYSFFWKMEEIQQLIISRNPSEIKFIGFSYIFNELPIQIFIEKICLWLKEKYPHIVLISGAQSQLEDLSFVDYHVYGYGEYALDSLLKYLFSNGEKPKFDFLMSRKTKVINAIHSYPAFPIKQPTTLYEKRDFIKPGEWGVIEFSRGCRFQCLFCNFPVLGVKEDHTRDSDEVREQMLRSYYDYGIENYMVSDETFNDYTEKITKYADVVESLPWKPFFTGFIRADLLISRKKDREELLRMGFLAHFYGIETFNYKSAKVVGKGMHPDKVKEGLIEIKNFYKNSNHRLEMGLIMGLPHETIESLEETYQWVKNNWIDQTIAPSVLDVGMGQLEVETKQSRLSFNYEKYGYKKMNEDDPQLKPVLDALRKDSNTGFFKRLCWENEHMNIIQATEYSNKFRTIWERGKYDLSKLEVFVLPSTLVDDDGQILSLDKKIKLNVHGSRKYIKNFFDIFLEEYKNNKLSL